MHVVGILLIQYMKDAMREQLQALMGVAAAKPVLLDEHLMEASGGCSKTCGKTCDSTCTTSCQKTEKETSSEQ